MRKLASVILFVFVFLSFPSVVVANANITMKLDYQPVVFDQMPINQNGRVYIPLRGVAELTGGVVDYNSQSKIITITKQDRVVVFHVNETKAKVNGIEKDMPKAILKNNRTLVPVRFLSENLGLTVDWKAKDKAVYIYTSDMVKIDGIIQHAERYIGIPYLWGGMTEKGMDCSAFVQRVFGERGIPLSRTTYTQVKEGELISKEQVKKGDLVFFDINGEGKPSHVAIYIDDNTLLHATVSKGVNYTSFNSYWEERVFEFRRVIF